MEKVKEKASGGDPDKAEFGKESPVGAGWGSQVEAGGGEHFRPPASTSNLRGLLPQLQRLLLDLLCGCESLRRLWGVIAPCESLMKQGKHSELLFLRDHQAWCWALGEPQLRVSPLWSSERVPHPAVPSCGFTVQDGC